MLNPIPNPTVVPPDFTALKAKQQKTWESGDFHVLAALIQASAEQLVQSADLQAGWRVLDVATGSGNAALAAARCGSEVTGVDYVPHLLARGRRRAEAEGLAIEFREADAEALPFADGSFDAAVSIYGVMFAPDQERAAREMARVVRPGGRIAHASWTPEGFVGEMFKVVSKHLPPPPAGLKPAVLWGTEKRQHELFGDTMAGLSTTRREFVFRFRSTAEFVEVFRRYYGPMVKAFEAVGETGAPALAADLEALARTWNRNGASPIAVPGEYLEVVAVRA